MLQKTYTILPKSTIKWIAVLTHDSFNIQKSFQTKKWIHIYSWNASVPSTKEVNSVTFAAFLRPAGRLSPSLSSFSLRHRPPFFDLALNRTDAEKLLTTRFIRHISREDLPFTSRTKQSLLEKWTFLVFHSLLNFNILILYKPTFCNDHRTPVYLTTSKNNKHQTVFCFVIFVFKGWNIFSLRVYTVNSYIEFVSHIQRMVFQTKCVCVCVKIIKYLTISIPFSLSTYWTY